MSPRRVGAAACRSSRSRGGERALPGAICVPSLSEAVSSLLSAWKPLQTPPVTAPSGPARTVQGE